MTFLSFQFYPVKLKAVKEVIIGKTGFSRKSCKKNQVN
jgi:hypothetical protein